MTAQGYPINLLLTSLACLVIGARGEAGRRAQNLLAAGATVTVIGEEPAADVRELAATGRLTLCERAFQASDLDGIWLVTQCEMDLALAATVAELCRDRRIFFCALDQPHGTFSHLALARSGSLTLAVGTEGRAPALGRKLRQELERVLTEASAGEQLERLARLRERTPPPLRARVLAEAVAHVRWLGPLVFDEPSEGGDDERG